MSTDQLENPRAHAHVAPQGEIRERPIRVLRSFTVVIAAALALPAAVLIGVGLEFGQAAVLAIGIALLIGLFVAYGILLWRILVSRTTHLVDAEEMERNSG